jgi:addiction module RelE/StbE family toxin
MKIVLHRDFERRYKKLKASEQRRVKERLALFLSDEFNPILNNHPLRGKYNGYRSINIAGDLRAIYKFQSPDIRIFVTLGTHHALYK